MPIRANRSTDLIESATHEQRLREPRLWLCQPQRRVLIGPRAKIGDRVGFGPSKTPRPVIHIPDPHEALYGLSPGTFEAFVDRVHPTIGEAPLDTVRKATQSGEDFTVQNRAIWPDGTVRWLRGMGRIHVDEHGEPARGIGISQDATEQRRTDAEPQRLNTEIQIQRFECSERR